MSKKTTNHLANSFRTIPPSLFYLDNWYIRSLFTAVNQILFQPKYNHNLRIAKGSSITWLLDLSTVEAISTYSFRFLHPKLSDVSFTLTHFAFIWGEVWVGSTLKAAAYSIDWYIQMCTHFVNLSREVRGYNDCSRNAVSQPPRVSGPGPFGEGAQIERSRPACGDDVVLFKTAFYVQGPFLYLIRSDMSSLLLYGFAPTPSTRMQLKAPSMCNVGAEAEAAFCRFSGFHRSPPWIIVILTMCKMRHSRPFRSLCDRDVCVENGTHTVIVYAACSIYILAQWTSGQLQCGDGGELGSHYVVARNAASQHSSIMCRMMYDGYLAKCIGR